MKTLILGAGAVGGYFGGRLVEKGEDVTFLVREKRQSQLKQTGLVIDSVHGDYQSPVKTIISGEAIEPYDLIILSVKAYHLENAIESVAPYVGGNTVILPLLNGLAHINKLQDTYGREKVIGGLCFVEATLGDHGEIIQASPRHDIVFGELDGSITPRVEQINKLFEGANLNISLSTTIEKDLWNKYIFITGLSGMTCLMEAAVGQILEFKEGKETYQSFIDEICAIAKSCGAPVDLDVANKTMNTTLALSYEMKASMCKDMEKGLPIEADHLQGNLIDLANKYGVDAPILKTVFTKLKIYEQLKR